MKHAPHKEKRHQAEERPPEAEAETNESNGRSAPPVDGQAAQRPALDRAEEMVDRLGEQLGQYATQAGQVLNRWLARAREEAEDMWAEAQSIRNSRKSQQ
jgi:hypothetical protein